MNNVSSSNSQKALVPELRFPEFREEWKKEKLSDFVVRVTRKNKDNQSNLPLTISSKDGLVDQVTYFNKKVSSKDMSGYYLLKNGEFAYNRSYSVGYDFGSIKRLDMYDEGALSTLYICFALKKHNSDFIKTYFDSLKWYKEIYMIAAEGARNHGLLNVPTEDFFDTIHTLPKSIDEQTKIADFLTLLEQRILKQEKLVNALKLYKRGLINQIFDNKLSLSKNSEWHKYQLSDILKERKTYCEKDGTYEHATLSKEGVYEKTNRYDRDYLVSSDDKKYKITKLGDICYNPANLKFGVICLNTYGDAIFSPIYITFEVNKNFNKEFIGFCLTRNDFINEALQYQQGTVYERMAVSPEDLLSMSINLPPKDIQDSLAKVFLKIEDMVSKTEMTLTELKQMRIALLQKMFI